MGALVGVREFALPRPTWKSVSIGRYKEVQLSGQPGSWRSLDQPSQSSVDRVGLHSQQNRHCQMRSSRGFAPTNCPDLGLDLFLGQAKLQRVDFLKGHVYGEFL